MKNKYLILFMFISALFCSCGDDDEGRVGINNTAPSKVSGVITSSGPGEVYLSWKIPTDPSFMYTKLEYINSRGQLKYQLFSKEKAGEDGIIRTTVSGFATTEPVKFSLFACAVKGNNQGAIEVEVSPDLPAFAAVAETVEVESSYGGVSVSWENTSVASVYIVLDYYLKNDPAQKGVAKFKVGGESKSARFVALTYEGGEFLPEEAVVNITVQDEEENASEVFTFESTPFEIAKLPKTGWSFPGYEDSYAATIGYNSQEAGGEGASPNGRVIAMIDDNPSTFWHTAWSGAHKATYPHFFILDMGKDTEISNVEIIRRLGNDGTHKGQTIYTCSDADATDKSNPDSWNWNNHGASTFNPRTDDPQLYGFAPSPINVRYIKVYFAASDKGTSDFVMISEVNVYSPKK